ncbi:Endonuclease/exonuclease/phosphatase [Cryomyces antarcticus]
MSAPSGAHLSRERPSRIRIITYNCWGLKFIAQHRHERLTEIGLLLAAADPAPDIVGLQECWTQQDYRTIRDKTKHILPYGKFYYSGIFGSGLAILSRWPIEESDMYRYPLNGRPAAFFRGDWYVGKGVASARIRFGPAHKDVAEVFCTHPSRTTPISVIAQRKRGRSRILRHASERGHLVIGLGDFNMRPLSLAHRLIEAHSPVRDVWRILHPDSSLGSTEDVTESRRGRPIPTIEYNLAENGATCDSALNTWRWNKGEQKKLRRGQEVIVDVKAQDPGAKRLDYIFFAPPHQSFHTGPALEWAVHSVNVGMTGRHPTLRCSLSDHFSVEATLVCCRKPLPVPSGMESAPIAPQTNDEPVTEMFGSTPGNSNIDTTVSLMSSSSCLLPISLYDEILMMIGSYNLRERRQRRLRLYHFGAEIVIAAGCLTVIWWSPRNFVSFLLMLLSTLGLSAGVIDGLMGGLFVGSELRALKEFEWEVKNARRTAAGGDSTDDLAEGEGKV